MTSTVRRRWGEVRVCPRRSAATATTTVGTTETRRTAGLLTALPVPSHSSAVPMDSAVWRAFSSATIATTAATTVMKRAAVSTLSQPFLDLLYLIITIGSWRTSLPIVVS